MPDITMCKGEECPLKENCYRYKATPTMYQSYFMNIPGKYLKENEFKCSHIWKILKTKED